MTKPISNTFWTRLFHSISSTRTRNVLLPAVFVLRTVPTRVLKLLKGVRAGMVTTLDEIDGFRDCKGVSKGSNWCFRSLLVNCID
jgi:hypothetical protein